VVLSPKAASAALAQIAAAEAAASAAAGVATGASASGVVQTLPGSNAGALPADSAAARGTPARPR
jgi:hypothetical protein